MPQLPYLDAATIEELHDYPALIAELEDALRSVQVTYPLRQHYTYGEDNTLLIMPCWEDGRDIGIKLVTVNPQNPQSGRPSIQGVVVYFSAVTGEPLALLDAAALTRKRTAAASALASCYLSRPESSSLLLLGTGALAPELVRAHAAVRPLRTIYLWGRTPAKAVQMCDQLDDLAAEVLAVDNYNAVAPQVDIISTATMATEPLLEEMHLRAGQHLDLVGAFRPHMREASDGVIRRAEVYVDTRAGALHESGDLAQPMQAGIITESQIRAELASLCSGEAPGRSSSTAITLFKSVGFALEDLVAARFYYERFRSL